MPTDFVPSKDADLLAFSANVESLIAAGYATYGLVVGDGTAYTAAHNAFAAALTAATDPATRTSATIATKDTTRATLVALLRATARKVQAWGSITPTLLTNLGFTVRDGFPSPLPAPSTQPVLSVETIRPGEHILRIVDADTPTSRAKGANAANCEIYVKRGTTPPASIADCVYAGPASKFLYTVPHSSADAGKTAYYIGRWVNRKGQPGPVSGQVSATIAA